MCTQYAFEVLSLVCATRTGMMIDVALYGSDAHAVNV